MSYQQTMDYLANKENEAEIWRKIKANGWVGASNLSYWQRGFNNAKAGLGNLDYVGLPGYIQGWRVARNNESK